MRDLIVVLPGITGSALVERGIDGRIRPLWSLSGGALWQFVRSLGRNLERLAVAPHDPREFDQPSGGIEPAGLIDGFHGVFGLAKIDGYRALVTTLERRFDLVSDRPSAGQRGNLIELDYDWRLSNRVAAHRLGEVVRSRLSMWRDTTGEPTARVIVIAHSMGGLVARYWLEVLGGWRSCRALVTFGTPYRGSLNAVGYVANGYKRALPALDTVLRSCPSVYELFPTYRAILAGDTWCRPHDLAVPNAVEDYIAAAAEFHDEIERAAQANRADSEYVAARYACVPIVGVHQTTAQSGRLDGSALALDTSQPSWLDADAEGGDSTVPRISAIPAELDGQPFASSFVGEQHGSLQNNLNVLDDLVERLKQSQLSGLGEIRGSWRPRAQFIDLVVDDLVLPGEAAEVCARGLDDDGSVVDIELRAEIACETDPAIPPAAVRLVDGVEFRRAELRGLRAGRYRITVASTKMSPAAPSPVTGLFEVAG